MKKQKKKIGSIPIDELKQEVNDFINEVRENEPVLTDSFESVENPEYSEATLDEERKILSYRKKDGTKVEGVGFETPKVSVDGASMENIDDPEGRFEVKTDKDKRIVSYRDSSGVLHENVGLKTPMLETKEIKTNNIKTSSIDGLSEKCKTELKESFNKAIPIKHWNIPKFGSVKIKEETFYLTADAGYSDKSRIALIQILEDNVANAAARLTLSYFYVLDDTIIGIGSDGNNYRGNLVTRVGNKYYVTNTLNSGNVTNNSIEVIFDSNSVSSVSTQLELHAKKDVVSIDGQWYALNIYRNYEATGEGGKTTVLQPDGSGGYIADPDYLVTEIKDVPPYMAWKVNKDIEHYCVADVDFGEYYSKNNLPVGIKFQGSGSTGHRKRGFRFTPYKKNDYAKKNKIKIGEFIRLSGYNMKSYFTDPSRLRDPILANICIEMYNSRGKDAYPWDATSVPYNGACGMIKSFPIETYFGDNFYGLQIFGYKKDEKNYMLDSSDDANGIFVSGDTIPTPNAWVNATPREWEDEFDADNKVKAYDDLPGSRNSVSVETAAAMEELFKYIKGFIEGTIEIDGQTVDFEDSMLFEHIDMASWIDYFIGLQVFQLYDSTYHNMILYTGPDKKKFYTFFYDLDASLTKWYNFDLLTDGHDHNAEPLDFWIKFADTFKDSIYNRYVELRKEVLSINNIKGIYNRYLDNIPQEVVDKEVEKWGNGEPKKFKEFLDMLEQRLSWLDETYFNIDKFN